MLAMAQRPRSTASVNSESRALVTHPTLPLVHRFALIIAKAIWPVRGQGLTK